MEVSVRKWILIGFALALSNVVAQAADADRDRDTTPVTKCEELPPSVSIEVMSPSDTTKICREMARVLEGIRHKDITSFEKAIYLLHRYDYEGDYPQITKELVEIIRLRGLYNKPDRWYDTNDLILRSWQAFNGVVGPRQVISFLRDAGPMAKTLSDDGLLKMIIFMKRQYQSGN
jgi:hypothetical protein